MRVDDERNGGAGRQARDDRLHLGNATAVDGAGRQQALRQPQPSGAPCRLELTVAAGGQRGAPGRDEAEEEEGDGAPGAQKRPCRPSPAANRPAPSRVSPESMVALPSANSRAKAASSAMPPDS